MTVTKGTGKPGADLLSKHFGALLSERELEVGRLAIRGISRAEMASLLFLSENTVKTHIRNILKKTGAVSLNDLYRRMAETEMSGQVPSRPSALGELTQMLEQGVAAGRGVAPTAVVVFEIDDLSGHFPLWFPHEQVVLVAGEQLARAVRSADLVTHWQGSWLLVMLAGTTLATAEEIGRRLSQKLQRWGAGQGLSLSIAMAACSTDEGIPPADLLEAVKNRLQSAGKPVHLVP